MVNQYLSPISKEWSKRIRVIQQKNANDYFDLAEILY
jgi:hypothetical protein